MLGGLPGFVGQLDLHQHSYDQNVAERLVARGEDYVELLEVLCMRCEAVSTTSPESRQTTEDLWTLLTLVQRKLAPYIDVISTTPNVDIHLSLNGSLASTVGSIQARGRPKMFVSKVQLESLFELGFTYAKVAKMLCISERTLQRRRSELGFPVGRAMLYSQMTDEELDETVSSVLQVLSQNDCICNRMDVNQ